MELDKLLSSSLHKILQYFNLASYYYAKHFPQTYDRIFLQFIYCALGASDGNISQEFCVKGESENFTFYKLLSVNDQYRQHFRRKF